MKPEEFNNLLDAVTRQLNEAGCEYFLSVMTKEDEAVLGSASINMNDIDAAAKLISESIKQGGAYGQRMLTLFGKVVTSLIENLADADQKDWSLLRDCQHLETHKAFHR